MRPPPPARFAREHQQHARTAAPSSSAASRSTSANRPHALRRRWGEVGQTPPFSSARVQEAFPKLREIRVPEIAPLGADRHTDDNSSREEGLMACWKALLTGSLITALAVPLPAHHGADAASLYKGSTPRDLTGTVARVEWMNPHAFLFLDVANAEGKTNTWRLELASSNTLERQGWTRDALKVGDRVTVHGTPANDGSPTMYVRSAVTPDGRQLQDRSTFARFGSDDSIKPGK